MNKKPIQAKPCKAPVVPRPGEKIEPGKKYYELELYVPPLSVVVCGMIIKRSKFSNFIYD